MPDNRNGLDNIDPQEEEKFDILVPSIQSDSGNEVIPPGVPTFNGVPAELVNEDLTEVVDIGEVIENSTGSFSTTEPFEFPELADPAAIAANAELARTGSTKVTVSRLQIFNKVIQEDATNGEILAVKATAGLFAALVGDIFPGAVGSLLSAGISYLGNTFPGDPFAPIGDLFDSWFPSSVPTWDKFKPTAFDPRNPFPGSVTPPFAPASGIVEGLPSLADVDITDFSFSSSLPLVSGDVTSIITPDPGLLTAPVFGGGGAGAVDALAGLSPTPSSIPVGGEFIVSDFKISPFDTSTLAETPSFTGGTISVDSQLVTTGITVAGGALAGAIVGGIMGILSVNTQIANRVQQAATRFEYYSKESSMHLNLVTASYASDYAEGNATIMDHGRRQYNSYSFNVNTSSTFVIDSPFVNHLSSQHIIQSRFLHETTDLHQGFHIHYWLKSEDSLNISSNVTNRSNILALRETSGEAEYIASKMVVYGDAIWEQAGQPIGKGLLEDVVSELQGNVEDAAASAVKFLNPLKDILSYGASVHIAQNHYAILARNGVLAMQGGLVATLDAPFVFINCGIINLKSLLVPKNFNNVKQGAPVAKTTPAYPIPRAQDGNYTPEPVVTPDSTYDLTNPGTFSTIGRSGASVRLTNISI